MGNLEEDEKEGEGMEGEEGAKLIEQSLMLLSSIGTPGIYDDTDIEAYFLASQRLVKFTKKLDEHIRKKAKDFMYDENIKDLPIGGVLLRYMDASESIVYNPESVFRGIGIRVHPEDSEKMFKFLQLCKMKDSEVKKFMIEGLRYGTLDDEKIGMIKENHTVTVKKSHIKIVLK